MKTIASTILQQLGGNNFVAMTGAKDFISTASGLQFSIPTCRRINRVTITLLPNDTYSVKFSKYFRLRLNTVEKIDGIMVDQLVETFENKTGLITRL